MSYEVLARKWRPRTFEEVAGQEHVLRALIQALNTERLHHAYIFTGTRGVGKTTIARLLAKCLNCESGISSKPCGQCETCKDIDNGMFVDLIEVDAASKTKVEDTRELLDNVQYAPTYGRFKIYLIDEVHMLSGHSFNALLKTLEEPPQHVKFLLATTDPQKLPKTILSRCLQFHLKNLTTKYISDYLSQILTKENITFEIEALNKIAKEASGSMRDALSILDQAIAFTHGNINIQDIQAMLGITHQNYIENILYAILNHDGKQLLEITNDLFEKGVDFSRALEDLISYFHAIAIKQIVQESIQEEYDSNLILNLSQKFSKEDIQLYYQIALIGRRDLHLANDPKTGFEMTLLRMLTFQPISKNKTVKKNEKFFVTDSKQTSPISYISISDWPKLLKDLNLSGMDYILASNCALQSVHNNCIELALPEEQSILLNEKLHDRLNDSFDKFFNQNIKLTINISDNSIDTPAKQTQKNINEQHKKAINTIKEDTNIKSMIDKFNVTIQPELIKVIKEEN